MNMTPLIGAIVGDIAGSRSEWLNCKTRPHIPIVAGAMVRQCVSVPVDGLGGRLMR